MIVVIDLGIGNLRSVEKALHQLGYPAQVTSHVPTVLKAQGVILPGVGAFGRAMAALRQEHLAQAVQTTIESGKPFMGICLGLQLLFEGSDEFGEAQGLGIFPGRVRRLSGSGFAAPAPAASAPRAAWDPIPEDFGRPKPAVADESAGPRLKVPHVGWNAIRIIKLHPVLAGIPEGAMFYFVHSYAAAPESEDCTCTVTDYGGDFVSAVGRGKLFACQFHPEKSGRAGLRMLDNFARMAYPEGPPEPPGPVARGIR
jgi:glutamine amidotransferase